MFSNDFKDRVFKVCLPAGAAGLAVRAFETNDHIRLRNLLEDLLDDMHLYENWNTGSNRKVKKNKIHTFEARQAVYSELMEMINTKLDSGELLSEHRVRF